MTLPVVATLGTNATGTTSAGVTVPVPASTADGDLLVMQVSCAKASGAGASASTINTPAGWVKIAEGHVAATITAIGDRMCIFVRIASSEPANYAVTATTGTSATDGMVGKMARVTGHRGVHKIGTVLQTTASTSAAITGVTTEVDDCLALYFGSWAAAGVVTSSHSLGTEQYDFGTDPGTAISVTMASLNQAAQGATGTDTVTIGSAIRVGVCVTIAPQVTVPTILEVGVNKTGNTSADITTTFDTDGPFLIISGDILVAEVAATSAATNPTLAANADYTQYKQEGNRTGVSLNVRVCNGTETSATFTATPDATTEGMTVKVARVAGVDQTTPVNANSVTVTTANTLSYVMDGVTTTEPDCLILYAVGGFAASTRTWTNVITEQWDFSIDPGDASSQTLGTKRQAVAGATGPETFTPSTNTAAAGVTIALSPSVVEAVRSRVVVVNQAVQRSAVI